MCSSDHISQRQTPLVLSVPSCSKVTYGSSCQSWKEDWTSTTGGSQETPVRARQTLLSQGYSRPQHNHTVRAPPLPSCALFSLIEKTQSKLRSSWMTIRIKLIDRFRTCQHLKKCWPKFSSFPGKWTNHIGQRQHSMAWLGWEQKNRNRSSRHQTSDFPSTAQPADRLFEKKNRVLTLRYKTMWSRKLKNHFHELMSRIPEGTKRVSKFQNSGLHCKKAKVKRFRRTFRPDFQRDLQLNPMWE